MRRSPIPDGASDWDLAIARAGEGELDHLADLVRWNGVPKHVRAAVADVLRARSKPKGRRHLSAYAVSRIRAEYQWAKRGYVIRTLDGRQIKMGIFASGRRLSLPEVKALLAKQWRVSRGLVEDVISRRKSYRRD